MIIALASTVVDPDVERELLLIASKFSDLADFVERREQSRLG